MKRTRTSSRRGQAGVALLEVLVSVLLFSLGVLGLIGLQARAINLSIDAEDRNRAALIANDIAAAMWTTRTVAIDAAAWTTRASNQLAGGLPGGNVTITSDATTNTADIVITWTPPQRAATGEQASRLTTRVALPPTP